MDKLDQLHRFSRKLTYCLNDLVTKAMLLSTEVTDADQEFLQREINLPTFTKETGRLLRQAQQDLVRKHGDTVGVNYRPCNRPFSLSFFGSWHQRAYITITEIGDLREESEALLVKDLRRWVELERDFLPARESSRGRNAKLSSNRVTTEELLIHAKQVCLNLVMQPMEIATKTRSPLSLFEKSNIEVLKRFDQAVSNFNDLEATTSELLNYCGLDAYCGESSISHRRCLGAIEAVWLPFVAVTVCDYAEPWPESTVNVWRTIPEWQREGVTEAFTHVQWIDPDDFKRMKLEFDAAIHNERYRLGDAKPAAQLEPAERERSEDKTPVAQSTPLEHIKAHPKFDAAKQRGLDLKRSGKSWSELAAKEGVPSRSTIQRYAKATGQAVHQ